MSVALLNRQRVRLRVLPGVPGPRGPAGPGAPETVFPVGLADIEPLPLGNGILSDGLFHTNAVQEGAVVVSKMDPDKEGSFVTGPAVLQCYIGMPTMDQTNFVAYNAPLVDGRRILPVAYFRTGLWNSSIQAPLFEPVAYNDGAITRFRFIGDYPLHTVLTGGITYLYRTGTSNEVRIQQILRLRPATNMPSWEDGQGGGQISLGASLASCDPPGSPLISDDFTDPAAIHDGVWVRKTINVCRDVVFYPGTSYEFFMLTLVKAGSMSSVDYGLRIESGGFSFLYDGNAVFKRLARALTG